MPASLTLRAPLLLRYVTPSNVVTHHVSWCNGDVHGLCVLCCQRHKCHLSGCKKRLSAEQRCAKFVEVFCLFGRWLLKRAISNECEKGFWRKPVSNVLGSFAFAQTTNLADICLGSTPRCCDLQPMSRQHLQRVGQMLDKNDPKTDQHIKKVA